jgi:transcriptional regulator of acetoin/glycerol metabolism
VGALTESGGNVLQAAKLLGWGRNTVYVRLRKYGLSPQPFRDA